MTTAQPRPLDGRVALVMGARTGIGLGAARRLARGGATVVTNSRSVPDEPVILAEGAKPALHLAGDVANEDDVARIVADVEQRFGRLNIIVNAAGSTVFVPHEDLAGISVDDWRHILEVNVIGAWNVAKAAAPLLEASGSGSIVHVSSMAGIRVTGSSLPYAVSKAALNHLTLTLAKALGPRGIRVNAVAPGFVDTPWTADYQDRRAEVAQLAPLRRVATPDDVAEAIALLVLADYVTGEILTVDGGLSLTN